MTTEWELARILHEARVAFCWGNWAGAKREVWPEGQRAEQNYGHNPQPWVDIALAQARALIAKGVVSKAAS